MATTLGDTSGTVGQTLVDVTSIIEHAVRRCGVSASVITSEAQQSARDNLFFILSNLATKGLSLWCVQRLTFGLTTGRNTYKLPVGTVDLLNVLQRQAVYTAATAVGLGVAAVTLSSALEVGSALVTPAVAGGYTLVLEYSDDGLSWSEAGRTSVVYSDNTPVGVDANVSAAKLFWRVRDLTDPLRAMSAGAFLSELRDVSMAQLSRDSYAEFPDKNRVSSDTLQYWYDKKFYQPQITFWPGPSTPMAVHVFVQRQIQDPGTFTNAVEVPQRWLDTVISLLAPKVCLELPKEFVPPDRYDKLVLIAATALKDAEDSETDGAPMRFAPNISCYTR
jgi:hypothetical protein